MMDARTRTFDALEQIAAHYGVAQDLEHIRQANAWHAEAIAMLAEAVATLLVEVKPTTGRATVVRSPRPRRNGAAYQSDQPR